MRVGGSSILIAGGYGVVGRRIAAELAPDYWVVVAGCRLEQAEALAAAIGHGVRGRELDVTVEASIAAALEGIAAVVSCIDQPGRGLLHAAIERGLLYTDITPHLVELGRGPAYEEIGAAARASGARVVLGTGIVPGVSNVIVRAVAKTLGGADDRYLQLAERGIRTLPGSLDSDTYRVSIAMGAIFAMVAAPHCTGCTGGLHPCE